MAWLRAVPPFLLGVIIVVTVDELKQLLPDELLAILTDELGTGLPDDYKIGKLISNAYEYFNAKLKNAPQPIIDEAVRNYVISRLYAYVGNLDLAHQYQQTWQVEVQSYLREIESISTGSASVKYSSAQRVLTDNELSRW